VTEGAFAKWKRLIKRKLLHNFRHAYIDVLSRQQSMFNEKVLTALCHLADGLAATSQADLLAERIGDRAGMERQIRRLRRQMRRLRRRNANLVRRLDHVEEALGQVPSPEHSTQNY
jgi:hypothetical protein